MRNVLSGLKIFKIVLFVSVVILSGVVFSSKTAFATDETGTITKQKCEEYGGRWDGKGLGTAWGVGCIFDRSYNDRLGIISSFSDMILRVDYYYPKVSKCHPSYDKKSEDGVVVCNRKKDADKNIKSNKINQDQCSELGGDWWIIGTKKTDYCKIYVVGSDYSDTREVDIKNVNDLPDYYRITSGDKFKSCRSGYILQEKEVPVSGQVQKRKFCMRKSKLDSSNNPTGSVDSSGENGGTGESGNSETSCAIDSIGWIVCPAASFMEDAITGTYEWIAKHFLTIRSGSLFDDSRGVFDSWSKFRDIANVLFVILFVVVIVSQITNVGISNYGIKKMLPRLVAFAILINISYWVSVIFVDLSNIIGRGIFNLLSANGNSSHINLLDSAVGTMLSTVGVSAVMGGVILALVAALLSIFLMFLILVVRQAAVVVLIVISPIAFASAILPGTEAFFSKWKGMLKSMLVVYPVCSLMMGGMIVASDVLISTIDDEEVDLTNYALKVFYILIPVIGLSSVYIVIKGTLAAIDKLTGGSISGKIGGMVNGLQDKAKNSSLAQRERNMWGGTAAGIGSAPGFKHVRDFSRRSRYKALSGKNKLENAKAEAERDGMIAELQSQASRGKLDPDGQRLLHKLQGDKEKDEANLLNAGASSMAKSFGYNEMGQFTGDVEGDAERALTEAMKSGNSQQIDRAIKAIGAANLSDGQRASVLHRAFSGAGHIDTPTEKGAAIAQAVSKNMDLFGKMKAENFAVNSLAGKLASNQSASLSEILQDTSTYSNMTAEQLTKQGGNSMENIRKLAANNPQFAAQMQNLAETASKDTELMAQAKGANKEFIDELKAGVQPSNVVNQESSTVTQENPTVNQEQPMPIDISYGESFVVPRDGDQQNQWVYPAPQQTQQTQQTKPTGQPAPTRKFVSGGINSGNPRHLTVNQQQLEKIRRSSGYNNTKKPE